MGSGYPSEDTGLSSFYLPPPDDEIEVSLFGPGYGECALIHIGEQKWVIVDSCLDPEGQPAALTYLDRLGLDPAESVCLVVTTHWHDDHIRGMAKVVEVCDAAKFCCANTLTEDEFVAKVAFLESSSAIPDGYGVRELYNVLGLLGARSVTPLYASPNRRIYRQGGCNVWTLSPSDALYQTFLRRIYANMPNEKEQRRRIPALGPNGASVVVLIEVDDTAVLLGGDLEIRGWLGILDDDPQTYTKASVFKVPHHGSENAYVCRVWEEMLEPNPVAALTPWRLAGGSLPTSQGIGRILSHTDRAYITTLPENLAGGPLYQRDSAVERTIRDVGVTLRTVSPSTGIVRLRRKMASSDGWRVEMAGSGCSLVGSGNILHD